MTNPEIPNLSDPLATLDYALARYNALVLFTEIGGFDEDDLTDDEIAEARESLLVLSPAERELCAARVGEDLEAVDLARIWADAGLAGGDPFLIVDRMFQVHAVLTVARRFFRQQSVFVEAGHLLQRCLEQALVFPERHNQSTWFSLEVTTDGDGNASLCGSTGCLAGHAVILGSEYVPIVNAHALNVLGEQTISYVRSESDADGDDPGAVAERLLELFPGESEVMFEPSRTLDELWELGEALYPGLVSWALAKSRREAIAAAGPLLRISRVALEDNGVIDAADIVGHEGGDI